jgi:hypothetical protein
MIFKIIKFYNLGGKKMEKDKMKYYLKKLKQGEIYWDKKKGERIEFGYMGQTGLAIVYEPGDSGGGMQSSWGINPEDLEEIISKSPLPMII